MSTLALLPLARLSSLAPLVVRVIVGVIMAAHGVQKLTEMGPATFGRMMLAELGVPLPVFFGYFVTFLELVGGILLLVGLLSRLSALLLTVDLVVAIVLVKVGIGLIAPMGAMLPGAELDLALIAGLVAILLFGPGRLSLDHALGLDSEAAERPAA